MRVLRVLKISGPQPFLPEPDRLTLSGALRGHENFEAAQDDCFRLLCFMRMAPKGCDADVVPSPWTTRRLIMEKPMKWHKSLSKLLYEFFPILQTLPLTFHHYYSPPTSHGLCGLTALHILQWALRQSTPTTPQLLLDRQNFYWADFHQISQADKLNEKPAQRRSRLSAWIESQEKARATEYIWWTLMGIIWSNGLVMFPILPGCFRRPLFHF